MTRWKGQDDDGALYVILAFRDSGLLFVIPDVIRDPAKTLGGEQKMQLQKI